MKTLSLIQLVSLFLGLLATGFISEANAANRFYLTCVTNQTPYHINYSWKYNGQWRSATLSPGDRTSISWQYDYANENSSPSLFIGFDAAVYNEYYYQEYQLGGFASPDKNCSSHGKDYTFVKDGNEYIDLTSKD